MPPLLKPGGAGSAVMPLACVQRNAETPVAGSARPVTTEPSAEQLVAKLLNAPPGKSPKPWMPPTTVQRYASELPPAFGERADPTTVEPSAEMPRAALVPSPPGSSEGIT